MNQSEQIDALAAALSKAQGEFPPIPKTRLVDYIYNGKRTTYKYADLSDVIDAIKGALSKYGLSHSEQLVYSEGKVILWTRLMHSSGQWLLSSYPITLGSKPQESGSAISFARRYALTALIGVQAEEDNDAQSAPPLDKGNKDDDDGEFNKFPDNPPNVWKFTDVHYSIIIALAKKAGTPIDDIVSWCQKNFGILEMYQMTERNYEGVVKKLNLTIEKATVK